MARTFPPGLSVGTTKYSIRTYGGGFEYGINFPPPVPYNLQVEGGPAIVDGTPTFSWLNPTFSWEVPYGDGDTLLNELQISFNDLSFGSIEADTNEFYAPGFEYTLAPEYTLGKEGTYYTRIRTTDGYTYSDWSEPLKFILFLFGAYPPSIDPVISPADGFWQVITGKKSAGLYIFVRVNNGPWYQAEYPLLISGSTWSYNVPLSPGNNLVEVISALTIHTEAATSRAVEANIYLIVSTPEVFNVWNSFDEFGLLLALPRIPGEKNAAYKTRLLDVYANPANSTYVGLKNGISRELGLTPSDIEINTLYNLMNPDDPDNILNPEGHALGTKLVDYADEVYDNNPIFWGNLIGDESYWDQVDEETNGWSYLPHIWDPTASGIYGKWQCGGIGDGDDLWVNDPVAVYNPSILGDSWYLPVHTGFFYSAYPSGIIGV